MISGSLSLDQRGSHSVVIPRQRDHIADDQLRDLEYRAPRAFTMNAGATQLASQPTVPAPG
jgi:hypothetical protein